MIMNVDMLGCLKSRPGCMYIAGICDLPRVKLPALPRGASVARPSGTAPKPTRLSIVRSKLLGRTGALRCTLGFPVAIPPRASARGILAKASEYLIKIAKP